MPNLTEHQEKIVDLRINKVTLIETSVYASEGYLQECIWDELRVFTQAIHLSDDVTKPLQLRANAEINAEVSHRRLRTMEGMLHIKRTDPTMERELLKQASRL